MEAVGTFEHQYLANKRFSVLKMEAAYYSDTSVANDWTRFYPEGSCYSLSAAV